MVIHGEDKRGAIERLLSYGSFDPEWPASIVHDHDDAEILIA
jgi:6-phosphogluconolactonase/glucosamine-6-phosphate isomerase/deaminase